MKSSSAVLGDQQPRDIVRELLLRNTLCNLHNVLTGG